MSDDPPRLTVRLKGDRIVLKLGTESIELAVTDGYSDDASHLARTIQGRVQEVLMKRQRALLDEYRSKR
jgi:hypothetical protein